MKPVKKIITVLLCAVLALGMAACGDKKNNGGGGGGTTEGGVDYNGTINIFVPFDTSALNGLNRVVSAYRRLHPQTTVKVTSATDRYTEAVEGVILAPEESDIDIVQINVVSQYYGTDKIIDFTSYLNQANPYGKEVNGKSPVWKNMLEEEAYLAESNSYTIPALSFESNYVMVSYSKQLFKRYGWSEPTNWAEMIALLQSAKDNGYANPLGLNFDKSGVESIMTGLVLQMYMDQYFRDIIDDAHSRDGDFSYIDSLDYDWRYDSEDNTVDSQNRYTYNISRLINAYFNTDKFNPASARFADMMANLKQLLSYSSTTCTGDSAQQGFHVGALHELTGYKEDKNATVVLYVNRMDYLSNFQTQIGGAMKGANVIDTEVIPAENLSEYLGWFLLPAMPDNAGVEGGAPASSTVRMFGGPNHHPMGVINRNNKKRTDLSMDFMKFWYSEQGMDEFYGYYSDLGYVCPLKTLVKGYELPDNVKIDTGMDDVGMCILNPYFEIGNGYNDTILSSSGGSVRDNHVAIIRDYLGAATNDWTSYGMRLYDNIRSGFARWADYKNLKFSSPSEYADNYINTPFKAKQ